MRGYPNQKENLVNCNCSFSTYSGLRKMNRLPSWFRQEIPEDITLERVRILSAANVHTVCQEARCPNLNYCFKNLRFTFILLGDTCTRNCRFCSVRKSSHKQELGLDGNEPLRIAKLVKKLGLSYVVITSVTRDDLADGGAGIFAKTVELIKSVNKNINPVRDTANSGSNAIVSNGVKIEVLIPDFQGNILSLERLLDAQPDIVAHNIETIPRLYPDLRPKAGYQISLGILSKVKKLKPHLTSKSSLMLGLGETEKEVVETMEDLRRTRCDILTLGQYLAPSLEHYPIKEFISLEQFKRYQDIGAVLGFKAVLSGPLVRSSYKAEELFKNV